jgi:hypothetical protein
LWASFDLIAREISASMLKNNSRGRAYVNFKMRKGEDRLKAAYRDNYERLADTKSTYNPANLFRDKQNIKSVG